MVSGIFGYQPGGRDLGFFGRSLRGSEIGGKPARFRLTTIVRSSSAERDGDHAERVSHEVPVRDGARSVSRPTGEAACGGLAEVQAVGAGAVGTQAAAQWAADC